MKIAGAIILILALVIGIVPQLTDCHSQGKVMTIMNGSTVEMKCFWTAMAAIATAVPLGILGGLLAFSKRKETRRMLAVLGATFGAAAIFIPTALIGVCANPMMLCNMVLKPTLILSGSLVALTSLIVLAITQTRAEEPQYDRIATGA
jgi:hypothetical protein